MNKFECSECGTKYSSPETTPPPGIKWSDGHVCTPKLIIIPKEETKQDLEKEMFELEQELDIPSHLRWHNSKPKQETTLEEFIKKQLSLGKYQDQESAIRHSIELGAKWQQETLENIKQFEDCIRTLDENFAKQETLEEAAEKYYPEYPDGVVTSEIYALREGFVKGCKVQQERMYSEEEVYIILEKFRNLPLIQFQEWFEKFKNK